MSKTIPQLKSLWNKEKESYKTQEVGSGVQRFVKEVLKSEEVFDLSEGELATKELLRKKEFLEEKAKKNKRADIIIYIDSDIVIPVEVERFGNIEAGEKQLFEYQHVWDKKYGVLTDGYVWRFYNNKLRMKTFTLEHILDDTATFVDFWKEYVQPKNYYLNFFEKLGQLELIVDDISVGNTIQDFFQDITTLIKSFQHKLGIKGYFETVHGKSKSVKMATEITYAYIIQFILYKTLVDNDFADFRSDFDDRLKRIHHGLQNESYGDILTTIRAISKGISKNIYKPFSREQEFINRTLDIIADKPTNQLADVTPWLDIFVFVKRYSFANVRNDIFGYIYENYLKDIYEEEQKRGQYFTDSSVVRFMLEQIGYTATAIKDKISAGQVDKLSIIDPACGSGTFLYSATDEVVKSFPVISDQTAKQIENIVTSNLFGLDVEEFPLYLAEMSILMRILPMIMGEKYNNPLEKRINVFWTQDSIAEFGSEPVTVGKQMSFPDKIIRPKLDSFVRVEEDLTGMKKSMTSIPRRRFDYVIGNPPYVGYNECAQSGVLIFDLLKQGIVNLNDIYGVNLHSAPGRQKKRPPKPNLYVFFLTLGLALCKDNGRLCYIIPQTILNAGDFDVIRYHLAKKSTIERIITFNRNLFIGRGLQQSRTIPTSSLILTVVNKQPDKKHKVDIVAYEGGEENIDKTMKNISEGKQIISKTIPQADLLKNFPNWNYITYDRSHISLYEQYRERSVDMSTYYDHTLADQQFGSRFYFDIGYDIDEKRMMHIPPAKGRYYELPRPNSAYWSIKECRGYWPDTRGDSSDRAIRLLQANQGYHLLESEYKILWSYMNPIKFHFTGRPVIWARNRYCSIGSNNKQEIMYLFSLLNSKLTKTILRMQLRSEYEKDLLISISSVKEYVRVPTISTQNKPLKNNIIEQTEQLLALEDKTLQDLVDFSGILMQKFADVQVAGNTLVLVHDKQKIELPIKGDTKLIAGTIAKEFGAEGLKLETRQISLPELRNLQVIDFEKQAKLKDYIDDLVFALHFNIPLKKAGLNKAEEIQKACSLSKHYRLL